MLLQYLGTSAAEGIPAMFCSCEKCIKARKLGGKNIRTRSQAIVDGKIVIDWPADTFWHGIQYGIDFGDISTIIITHMHADHYYTDEFHNRKKGFSVIKENVPLTVYGSEDIELSLAQFMEFDEPHCTKYQKIVAFETFTVEGDYKITPLIACHGTPNPFIFIIEHQGKALLYGNDTGTFAEETVTYLRNRKIVFDLISLDCTDGTKSPMSHNSHMNLEKCVMTVDLMKRNGNISNNTIVCLNHFTHNGENVLYEDMAKAAEKYSFLVSYDGMQIEV